MRRHATRNVSATTSSTSASGARRRASLIEKLTAAVRPETFSQVDGPDAVLVASLKRLSATDQEVLALAAWEELAPREAAVVLDVSPTWYRVRLHRAKKRLLRELERSESAAGQPRPMPTEGIAK